MSCRNISNQKLFVYQEMRSKLTLENVDSVESTSIKIDGCEINDDSVRCDYMHLAKEIEFYIELKGQDLEHALEQIKSTINRLILLFDFKINLHPIYKNVLYHVFYLDVSFSFVRLIFQLYIGLRTYWQLS